jgi:hypothetical protein
MKRISCVLAAAIFLFSISASAKPGEADGDRRQAKRRGPPAVALEACSESADQDPCSFEGRNGDQLSGTCEVKREQLACVPEGHRERKRERRDDD